MSNLSHQEILTYLNWVEAKSTTNTLKEISTQIASSVSQLINHQQMVGIDNSDFTTLLGNFKHQVGNLQNISDVLQVLENQIPNVQIEKSREQLLAYEVEIQIAILKNSIKEVPHSEECLRKRETNEEAKNEQCICLVGQLVKTMTNLETVQKMLQQG